MFSFPKLKSTSLMLTFLIIFSIILPKLALYPNVKAQDGLPLISVAAPQTVTAPGTRIFNVSVWLESQDPIVVSNYQVSMAVNDEIVSVEAAWLARNNGTWIFSGKNYVPVEPYVSDNNGNGLNDAVKFGSSLLGTDSVTVTNPVLLGIIELRAQNVGTTILNISTRNKFSGLYETFLEDSYGGEIPVERQNGQVTIEGYLPEESSTITLEVAPSSALVGQNVTLSGKITPRIPNANVRLEQRQRYLGGWLPWILITTVKTNQTSIYRYIYAFQEPGTFQLKASWAGNETYEGNSSSLEMIVWEPSVMFEMSYAKKNQFLLGEYDVPVPTKPATINVTVENVTDLYRWMIKLYFDQRYIDIDEIWLPSDNALNLTGLEYNETITLGEDEEGDYLLCEAEITETGNGYTGNATLFQLNVTGLVVTMGTAGEGGWPTTMEITECVLKNSTGSTIFYEWNLVKVSGNTLFEEGIFYIYIAGQTTTIMRVVNPETEENQFRFISRDVSVGTTFNVTIQIESAIDLYGWILTLTYNPNLINVTRVVKPQDDPTYVFYNKESIIDYTILAEGSVQVNNTSTDIEPFQGDGLLIIIEFQILVAEPPGNETDLRTSLTLEESRFFTGINWRGVAGEDGLYWLSIEDGLAPAPSLLADYWPYLLGILIVVILIFFLVIRRLRKRSEVIY